ncbi:MAG: RNA methyltransferase [Solirubrobacterales bacterium]
MITSYQNDQIKELRKLQQKRNRERFGLFAAEGEDLVEAALEAGWQPKTLFCTELAPARLIAHDRAELVGIEVLDAASSLGSGSRVIGVFAHRWAEPADFELAVYLDGVADPGNIGTILRTALAFADGPVILGPGCADPFSPKAVRASMGAVFRRPPARAELADLAATRIALDGTADHLLTAADRGESTVICVGSERDGLSETVLTAADLRARIAMRHGAPESLNAAVAAAIALYELGGQVQSAVHASLPAGDPTGLPHSDQN